MRNSLLVTSDLKSVILVDTMQDDQRLSIGKRGVLLSVLGTDVCASEVPAELDNFITAALVGKKAFYEFEVLDAAKNQLCITYNDVNNAVFIIGITDIVMGLTGPNDVPQNKVKTTAVKMKNAPETGFASPNVILTRLETVGSKRFIKFYYLSAVATTV